MRKVTLGGSLVFDGFPAEFTARINEHFKLANPEYRNARRFSRWHTTNIPEHVYGGVWFPHRLILPRAVQIPDELLGKMADVEVQDERTVFPVRFPAPVLPLNPAQERVSRAYVREMEQDRTGYLVQAGTAMGKTILLLNLARLCGQRTLVIVHRTLIYKAWEEDAQKFYGKGRLDIGYVQGPPGKWRIGKHVTLAMAQTLLAHRNKATDLLQQFGCMLLDEAHICPIQYIQSIVSDCPAKYRIGATATPKRRDGLHPVLFWHFGEPWQREAQSSESAKNCVPISEARFVRTTFQYHPSREELFDIHELTDQLHADNARNGKVALGAYHDWKEGHYPLVATTRLDHVEHLKTLAIDMGVPEDGIAVLTGRRTHKQMRELTADIVAGRRRYVVATQQFICEGANIPPLDRLHVVVPTANRQTFTQLCGRIARASPGKKDAKIIVYLDMLCTSLRRRVGRYMLPVLQSLKVPGTEDIWIV